MESMKSANQLASYAKANELSIGLEVNYAVEGDKSLFKWRPVVPYVKEFENLYNDDGKIIFSEPLTENHTAYNWRVGKGAEHTEHLCLFRDLLNAYIDKGFGISVEYANVLAVPIEKN